MQGGPIVTQKGSREKSTPPTAPDGLSANRKLSSDALCLAILREVFERKSSDFRPLKLPPLSTLYRAVRCDVFCGVFSSPLRRSQGIVTSRAKTMFVSEQAESGENKRTSARDVIVELELFEPSFRRGRLPGRRYALCCARHTLFGR